MVLLWNDKTDRLSVSGQTTRGITRVAFRGDGFLNGSLLTFCKGDEGHSRDSCLQAAVGQRLNEFLVSLELLQVKDEIDSIFSNLNLSFRKLRMKSN